MLNEEGVKWYAHWHRECFGDSFLGHGNGQGIGSRYYETYCYNVPHDEEPYSG